ncbi:MAG: M15 family metallopeptidase [Clostridia bacterium]|nr:M15 family metallopeptidase [Clostridia bacterium]
MLPEGFVFVKDVIPSVQEDIRYAGCHNFIGRPVDGYGAPHAVLTCEAASALRGAADAFAREGYTLLLYDGYRPQRAVDHFVRWSEDLTDTAAKAEFYPALEKGELFERGYIARRSGHTRGSTIDLTLLDREGKPLDMGGEFDWFSPVSGHDYAGLTDAQRENRLLLRRGMMAAGFLPYSEEWWHYRLADEPYPDTYFDFPIEA